MYVDRGSLGDRMFNLIPRALRRAVSVIHLLYNSTINIGVTANKNMFINNVQTLPEDKLEWEKFGKVRRG